MLGGSKGQKVEENVGGRSGGIVLHRVMCPKMHSNG
jgi:hypothetical protein